VTSNRLLKKGNWITSLKKWRISVSISGSWRSHLTKETKNSRSKCVNLNLSNHVTWRKTICLETM
jgi:hypothetical protein